MRGLFAAILAIGILAFGCANSLGNLPLQRDPPPYTTESFSISPNTFVPITYPELIKGNTLEGFFVVEGGQNDLGFRIQAPNGGYLVNIQRVTGRYDFRYVVGQDGPYTLVFDNGFSWFTSKYVTASYRAYR